MNHNGFLFNFRTHEKILFPFIVVYESVDKFRGGQLVSTFKLLFLGKIGKLLYDMIKPKCIQNQTLIKGIFSGLCGVIGIVSNKKEIRVFFNQRFHLQFSHIIP